MANIGTTNVPAIDWSPNGPLAPSGPAVLAGVQADYNVAFNVSFNFNGSTPQGQLTATMAAVINDKNQLLVYYATQVDPAYAAGRMQDAIARIYFLERNGAEPTSVSVVCTGQVGVVIPVGSLAIAQDGNIYSCTADGTIGAGGNVTLPFACTIPGPISCPAGSVSQIYKAIPGWDAVDNPTDGIVGRNAETRQEFEARRRASVAQNSIGPNQAVLGAVLAVANVLDAYVVDNVLDVPQTIGGVVLAPHSIYVAVVGGLAADVAKAIWSKKAPGCNYNGNTTETVVDDNPAYSPPAPSYDVTFEIPASLSIVFAVRVANSALVPSDAAVQIQAAIVSAFAGGDGGPRQTIGSTVFASRYITPVRALGDWAQIISLKVGSTNAPSASFTATIAGTVMTVSAVASGALAIGQTIFGAGVTPGTTIVSFGTGGGGTGTYNISNALTIPAPEAMKGVVATLDDIPTNIDQSPTVAAANVIVSVV